MEKNMSATEINALIFVGLSLSEIRSMVLESLEIALEKDNQELVVYCHTSLDGLVNFVVAQS